MQSNWYRDVICSLCEYVGIADWEEVAAEQKIEIGGFPVALFPEVAGGTTLGVYVEVSGNEFRDSLEILRRLLESNIRAGKRGIGHFSLVPGQGIVAYRASIPLVDRMPSQDLMRQLVDIVDSASMSLHEALAGCIEHKRLSAARGASGMANRLRNGMTTGSITGTAVSKTAR